MKINLPTDNFSFFKVVSGFLFFLVALLVPVMAVYAYLMGLVVARAHGIGAWFAMWRAKKFTWKYIFWMSIIILAVSFWSFETASIFVISFVTHLLFSFHFLYDEFDLQEERRNIGNIISSLNPTVLILLALFKDFLHLNIGLNIFVAIALVLMVIEFIFLKEINWFFIHTKVLTIFILSAIFLSFKSTSIINLFIIYHYFFWFIYPVYKMHKYKREERDGLIMILLLLIFSSVHFASAVFSKNPDPAALDLVYRTFMAVTVIHILSTPPFAFFIGLKEIKYS